MKDRLLILALGLTIGLVIGTVFAPAPATSQGRAQPVSIAWKVSELYVLYDNAEVWWFNSGGIGFQADVTYPGASATQRSSWGRIKSEFADE